jgi:hypothetical protein|tara:strand:- start:319 stop:585 length:267 start_codon:yes stop_codon:yes gene_type:complete
MAITRTTSVQRCEVYPLTDATAADTANSKHPSIMVVYIDAFDDTEDATLPVQTNRVVHFNKFVEDGGASTTMSGEATLVQTIATAIWA